MPERESGIPSIWKRIGTRLRQQRLSGWWGGGGHIGDVVRDEYADTEYRLRGKIETAKTISERKALRKTYAYKDFATQEDFSEGIGNWAMRGSTGVIIWRLIIPGVRTSTQHGYIDFMGIKQNLPERGRRIDYRTASWCNILRSDGIGTLPHSLDRLAKAIKDVHIDWNNPSSWKGTVFEEEWEGFRGMVDLAASNRNELKSVISQYMQQLNAPLGSDLDYSVDVIKLDVYQGKHGIKGKSYKDLKPYCMDSEEGLGWNEDDWNVFEAIYKAKDPGADTKKAVDEYIVKYPLEK